MAKNPSCHWEYEICEEEGVPLVYLVTVARDGSRFKVGGGRTVGEFVGRFEESKREDPPPPADYVAAMRVCRDELLDRGLIRD